MQEIFEAKGLFLSKEDIGEADTFCFLSTEALGGIKVLAKGFRKITSKLRGSLPLFSAVKISFVRGKSFNILTGAELIYEFTEIKEDLEKLVVAEKLGRFLAEWQLEGEDKEMWEFQRRFWWSLEKVRWREERDKIWTQLYFKGKLLQVWGLLPEKSEKEIIARFLQEIWGKKISLFSPSWFHPGYQKEIERFLNKTLERSFT